MKIETNGTLFEPSSNKVAFQLSNPPTAPDQPSVGALASLTVPLGVYTSIKSIGKNRYDATVYDARNSPVGNIEFSVVKVGNKPTVRIDTRTSLQGGGVDTFNLATVAKWAEENGISQVVAFAGKSTAEWYKKSPRSFTPQTGTDSEGKTFNMIGKDLWKLTSWIMGKDVQRQ